jgi:chromosome segregation ATPase
MRRLAALSLILLVSGCAWIGRDASRALADADARAARGDYPAAMAAYEAYLKRYPDDEEAERARAARALVADLLTARAERDRLTAELARQGGELTKLRHELSTRQAEVARLKEDLEALKRTDLQIERRRR